MMALHAGLRRAAAPAAIVGYSGLYVTPEGDDGPERAQAEIRGKPPVLLVHGAQDDLIPAQALFISANLLSAAEVPVEWHLSPGVGHGIDGDGLRHGGMFLASAFGRRA
jgi:phospholipase/carboxylesterase